VAREIDETVGCTKSTELRNFGKCLHNVRRNFEYYTRKWRYGEG
jgi:hypothetical protein